MKIYICPDHITEVFDTDPARGRGLALTWYDTEVKPVIEDGDLVWLPEIGCVKKTPDRTILQ